MLKPKKKVMYRSSGPSDNLSSIDSSIDSKREAYGDYDDKGNRIYYNPDDDQETRIINLVYDDMMDNKHGYVFDSTLSKQDNADNYQKYKFRLRNYRLLEYDEHVDVFERGNGNGAKTRSNIMNGSSTTKSKLKYKAITSYKSKKNRY